VAAFPGRIFLIPGWIFLLIGTVLVNRIHLSLLIAMRPAGGKSLPGTVIRSILSLCAAVFARPSLNPPEVVSRIDALWKCQKRSLTRNHRLVYGRKCGTTYGLAAPTEKGPQGQVCARAIPRFGDRVYSFVSCTGASEGLSFDAGCFTATGCPPESSI
jgi:hypothetical protein